ncbi:Gfo/Idh/MocA family protein [Halocatena marina]|uniref:Gfo/Idh/MocA family protein n=1 Tax=Halocatena marina TaxID=2934937 RepID=UPI00200C4BEF|nr:Gfo/Idh/MocA family oxidoreductase [Halocatena marina]
MGYRIAFIGTGPEPDNPVWGESAAMAYRHAPGYRDDDRCEIVSCADLVRENAEAFAQEFDIDTNLIFEDYNEMLREIEPDIVSVCTPVPTHAPIVLDCIRSGILKAIHCEKPMATTWEDARRMAQEAAKNSIQLTFNHQRRFVSDWREPKERIENGEIGELQRLEVSCGELLDNGTHYIDLANFYNDECSSEWVLGGLDYRTEHIKYGAHNENHGLAVWAYENGVHGLISTGVGEEMIGARNRIIGTDGTIEVHPAGETGYRIRRSGDEDWQMFKSEDEHCDGVKLAIDHVINCLDTGEVPEISARRALAVTKIIFGAWESVRQRSRVDFPLTIDDNPLESMVQSGDINPVPEEEQ